MLSVCQVHGRWQLQDRTMVSGADQWPRLPRACSVSLRDERELRLALGKGQLLAMCANFDDFGRGCVKGGFHSVVGTVLVWH